jgi:hypothetical protein
MERGPCYYLAYLRSLPEAAHRGIKEKHGRTMVRPLVGLAQNEAPASVALATGSHGGCQIQESSLMRGRVADITTKQDAENRTAFQHRKLGGMYGS